MNLEFTIFGTNVVQLLSKERCRRTVSNVIEPIQKMDILDRGCELVEHST